MVFRTDLAVEARELLKKDIGGTDYFTQKYGDITLTRLKIKTREAADKMGKPEGTYLTFDVPPFSDDFRDPTSRIKLIGKELASLLPTRGLILVAGLGNTEITPDNLGPKTAKGVLATRHITGELARSTGLDDLRPVAVLAPGVLGQTGIETGELLYSVTQKLHPAALIVVDALASRKLDRLGCTVQVSDTGISPGSGVGNARPKIDRQTMGVPVVSMGVPTVVDAMTLAADLLGREKVGVEETVSPRGEPMVVTPREIDLLIDRAAKLVSMAINHALQPSFSLEDLVTLVS